MRNTRLPLTKNEEKVWHYILGYFSDNTFSPTLHEIADAVGFNNRQRVHALIKNIQKKGYPIWHNNNKHRNIGDPKDYATRNK